MPTIEYKQILLEKLRNIDYAAGYLTACYEEGIEVFLQGIKDVIEANREIEQVVNKSSFIQDNILLKDKNIPLSNISTILEQLGLEMSFKPKRAL